MTALAIRAALAALLPVCGPVVALAQAPAWNPPLVALDESGDRNIPNFRFDDRHTAGGHFQITDTNWRHYAPLLGIDLAVWPNAMSAPEQLQGQVAGKMYAETGYMPWVPFNARLRRDLAAPETSRPGSPALPAHQPASPESHRAGVTNLVWRDLTDEDETQ
jgi:hypothetical protein